MLTFAKYFVFICFPLVAVTAASGQVPNTQESPSYDMQEMLVFVPINPGEFQMGSPAHELFHNDNETRHLVRITKLFYIGKGEVTQYLWKQIMTTEPSKLDYCPLCPVENVNWYQAIEFCIRLSLALDLEPAYTIVGEKIIWNKAADGMRLPTEAEWEYVYRAGSTSPFPEGNCLSADDANFNGYLPYGDCPDGMWRGQTLPVGSFSVNAWGVFDLDGNVAEWCWDRYEKHLSDNAIDPEGPAIGEFRVMRGGAFNAAARHSRCARRVGIDPIRSAPYRGFRLAFTPHVANGSAE